MTPSVSRLERSWRKEPIKILGAQDAAVCGPPEHFSILHRASLSRNRGIAILADMWPVVAKEHLAELKSAIVCVVN